MSHESELAKGADEMIELVGENDHAIYHALGRMITVTWMGRYRLYLCMKCKVNVCADTDRVQKWREAHS